MLVKRITCLCISCSAWHSALHIVGAHQIGLNRYLESTRMVILTGQFLLNFRNLQQIPLTDQSRQFSNNCHMLWYSPRHLLELWVILNKGLPWERKHHLGVLLFLDQGQAFMKIGKKIGSFSSAQAKTYITSNHMAFCYA